MCERVCVCVWLHVPEKQRAQMEAWQESILLSLYCWMTWGACISNVRLFRLKNKNKKLSFFHPTITALSQTAAILSSVTSVKSQLISAFLSCLHQRWRHTHTHVPLSHPFSSPSDELLSCLLYIGSMQPHCSPAASHRTIMRTPTS